MSNPFFSSNPSKPHLVRPGGLKGLLSELSQRLEKSFDLVNAAIGGGGGGSGGGILWRPSGGGDATTWNDVRAILAAVKVPIPIWFNDPGPTPVITSGVTDMHGSWFQGVGEGFRPSGPLLSNGAVLRNMGPMRNMGLVTNQSSPCFVWDFDPGQTFGPTFIDSSVQNNGSGPLILVPDGEVCLLEVDNTPGNNAGINGSAGKPIVTCGNGSIAVVIIKGAQSTISDYWVSGPASAFSGYLHDGNPRSNPPPSIPDFLGTGNLNVPAGIEGGSGPTSFRPFAGFFSIPLGCQYFDTDLSLTIFWNGTAWTDASGAPV